MSGDEPKKLRTFVFDMNEKLSLAQKQAMVQTLAPLQVRYVKMLEMNAAAIEDEVERQLDENPALEAEKEPESQVDISGATDSVDYDREDDRADIYAAYRRMGSGGDNRMPMEANAASETLAESLQRQISELELTDHVRRLAMYIVGNLDDNGRLTRSPQAIMDDIAIHTGLEIDGEDMHSAMSAVRSLDPAGVGASDLRDCLMLQLERRARTQEREDAMTLLDRYFDLFVVKNFDRLRVKSGLSEQRLEDAVALIRTLNPKPGNSQAEPVADRAMHITPDFMVEPDENYQTGDRFIVTLTQNIPELVVSESYNVKDDGNIKSERNDKARLFIRSRRQEANEFIDLLARRNATLLAVMKAIVKVQAEFFRTEDPASIKPMILKDISEITDKDLSVISRATSGKYVATPGGVYPLKMFFNERPHDDMELSSHKILTELKTIIESEDKRKPLSDDALTEMLVSRGMPIARRTVAKYREQLNIPNSRGRRIMKSKNTQDN